MKPVRAEVLSRFVPTASLSSKRLNELASLCYLERVNKGIDPLRMNVLKNAQMLYLVSGDLGVRCKDGSKRVLRGGTPAASHALDPCHPNIKDSIAITDIDIVRIDMDLLDIMLTWDQLSSESRVQTEAAPLLKSESSSESVSPASRSALLSVEKLKAGPFSQVPTANIEKMLERLIPQRVKKGAVIISQGAVGDYYYLIESGVAAVSKLSPNETTPSIVAKLTAGMSFGEEALVSNAKRNATVTMETDGTLLKLSKEHFDALLKAPLLKYISLDEANEKVNQGAIWADVRLPSEYAFEHKRGAMNLPLNQIRESLKALDKSKEYIVYCQTGRRSSAAAFIMSQQQFNCYVLTR